MNTITCVCSEQIDADEKAIKAHIKEHLDAQEAYLQVRGYPPIPPTPGTVIDLDALGGDS